MRRFTILFLLALCGEAFAQGVVPVDPNAPGYTVPGANREPRRSMERGMSFLGEVRAFDKAAGTVTLKHGSIPVLSVPARTADYAVKDASMLERGKVGEAVRFNAVLQGRTLLITSIVPAD